MGTIKEKIEPVNTTKQRVRESLDEVQALMNELTHSKLVIMEKEYDLSEWITLSDYARKYELTISRVQQWVSRGVVPADSVIVVPELNYLKLIKNKPYQTRATV